MSDKKLDELKLNYSQILLLGFGFLASSLTWAVYNAQVPLILRERFMLNSTLIGTVMTIDNFFGIIFQPLIGAWSDNTHTRIGRRLPWILFSLPLCAILFTLIPLQTVLWMFMLVVIGFNLMMSLWRSPVVALMADVTPAPLRSQANGMINLLGGVGAITALFFGGYLSDLREDKFYAFLMAAVVMLFVLLILGLFIRDPASLTYREINKISTPNTRAYQWAESARQDVRVSSDDNLSKMMENNNRLASLTAFRALPAAYKRSLTALLGAVFAWFLGLTAVETFFTLYETHAYHLTGGQASRMLAGFSLTFLICAVPAGLLGQKIGRKNYLYRSDRINYSVYTDLKSAASVAAAKSLIFRRGILGLYQYQFLTNGTRLFIGPYDRNFYRLLLCVFIYSRNYQSYLLRLAARSFPNERLALFIRFSLLGDCLS